MQLIHIDSRSGEGLLIVRSLTFECLDPNSPYYGKSLVVPFWSIEHDRSNKPATNPCWNAFGMVLKSC